MTSNKVRCLPMALRKGTQMKSRQGNTVTRIARDGDPAVKISRSGVSATCCHACGGTRSDAYIHFQNDVVKLAHELNEVKEAE